MEWRVSAAVGAALTLFLVDAAYAKPPAPVTVSAPTTGTQKLAPTTHPLPRTVTRNQPLPPPHPTTTNPATMNPRQSPVGTHPGMKPNPAQKMNQAEKGQGLPKTKAPKRSSMTVANVMFPGDISYRGARLALNGAGVHKQWYFFDKYAAALYLAKPTKIVAVAVASDEPKAISISMLADMQKADFLDPLQNSFKQTADEVKGGDLMQKWDQFKTFFSDLKKRDKVIIGYIPNQGTAVTINGTQRGVIPGENFGHVVIGIWLGGHPADGRLKDQLMAKQT